MIMRIANVNGRLTIIGERGGIDVEKASNGRFKADPQAAYEEWAALRDWARSTAGAAAAPVAEGSLASPAPRPRQVFGIGLNYRDHAAEANLPLPERPATFTKFPSCITGPYDEVELPSGSVDWEVELVVVIGVRAYRVPEANGWDHVAGLAVGQDLSERVVQWGAGGQFSLGKSFPGFGPIGPHLVTPDELPKRNDLALRCTVNGEVMQQSRTSEMVFDVPRLVAELSAILPLLPGDVIFTGTPAGVGAVRKPPRFLTPGDVVESTIEGLGTIRNRCVAAKK
jgi:2-keto-4-pentenoate hydratase/2-oxohepta-3-ene-1,7-dioic acid hydratase in catechol pathway